MSNHQLASSPRGETSASTGTVSRALQLLAVLADAEGSVTVKHVAETMQLPPSTAHRLLNLLRQEGFVDVAAEGRQYSIGHRFYRVAARVIASTSPVDLVQPVLEELARTYDETVLFGLYLPVERAMCFAARADGQNKLAYRIDLHLPQSLVWGASGKSILAFLPPHLVEEILAAEGPSPASGAAVPTLEALTAELRAIAKNGHATSQGEKLVDARAIAAPVFGPAGVIGCICMTFPKSRALKGSIKDVVRNIVDRANDVSASLGAGRSTA